jgi:hypothetical protein
MNIQDYHDRIKSMHTTTGIPSYWQQLVESQQLVSELKLIIGQLEMICDPNEIAKLKEINGDFAHAWKTVYGE